MLLSRHLRKSLPFLSTHTIKDIPTPAALVDVSKMIRNLQNMQFKTNDLGVKLRPHAKTAKCVTISKLQADAGACGITVSTMKEAEEFFAGGINDIMYAVGITENKLSWAQALMAKNCDLKIITDSIAGAKAIQKFGELHNVTFKVLIEIDTDGCRAGISPDSPALVHIANTFSSSPGRGGAVLLGVMTHAGGSYYLDSPEALQAFAEQERSRCVQAAITLRAAGHACPIVSTGSTPTALSALHATDVSES
jgi:D-serine deaminase-like pyridoxal phosphate-dependent protein